MYAHSNFIHPVQCDDSFAVNQRKNIMAQGRGCQGRLVTPATTLFSICELAAAAARNGSKYLLNQRNGCNVLVDVLLHLYLPPNSSWHQIIKGSDARVAKIVYCKNIVKHNKNTANTKNAEKQTPCRCMPRLHI
jgi:hypothetical protein